MSGKGLRKCRECGPTSAKFYAGRKICATCYNTAAALKRDRQDRLVRQRLTKIPEMTPEQVEASRESFAVGAARLSSPPRRWGALEAFDRELAMVAVDDLAEEVGGGAMSVSLAPKPPVVDVPPPKIEVIEEKITQVEEHRLKAKIRDLSSQIKSLTEELSDANAFGDILREAREQAENVPGISPRERASGIREGTCLVLASDWHIEEEVKPEQVSGRNRYNLDISAARMTRFFEATRWGLDFNRQAFKVRDLVLWLGGDLITNYLHEDNTETNLLSPSEAIAYAFSAVSDGISYLLLDPELERIVVPCNDGNHGRLTKKMRSASRIQNSIEILLYRMLSDRFKGEPRVQFIIATSSQLYYDVYGRTIRFTHGDTTKYGGGVGGITIPIRKAIARWQSLRKADLTCMGHYHQYHNLEDLIINGSLIGFNSYAMDIGAQFEAPMQALTMLDPRRWRSVSMPLHVSELSDDNMTEH